LVSAVFCIKWKFCVYGIDCVRVGDGALWGFTEQEIKWNEIILKVIIQMLACFVVLGLDCFTIMFYASCLFCGLPVFV
jgi:hypothetical protein